MKKHILLFVGCLFLVACGSNMNSNTMTHTIIDWVDFVKVDDVQYAAIYSGVIADPKYIGEEIAEVTFKMDENITNSSYKAKNGDAAYLEVGTKIYAVKESPEFLAVKDQQEINGYKIYRSEESSNKAEWPYQMIHQDDIQEIEIYEGSHHPDLIKVYEDEHEISSFMEVFDNAKEDASFIPDTSEQDPEIYHIVFQTDAIVAAIEPLFYDGNVWYWHPNDIGIVPDQIESFIR